MKTLKLTTEGMHCPSCEMLIEMSLGDNEGITDVKASYPNEQVEVAYDPEVISENKIIKTIQEAGYQVEKIRAE